MADSIQAQDSLEKMLVHQMAVLHRGMMRAAARMNEELYAAAGRDEGRREAANMRACRLAGAISRLSATYLAGRSSPAVAPPGPPLPCRPRPRLARPP